jgi:hypothetical protein
VLGDVGRERGVERAGLERGDERVAAHEVHVRIVLAGDAQRAPAVVDAERPVAHRFEEGHPAPRAAARLEDLEPPCRVLAERRRRHLVLVDGGEMDVVVGLAGEVLRPALLRVGLVEAAGDLFAEILLEGHGRPRSFTDTGLSNPGH